MLQLPILQYRVGGRRPSRGRRAASTRSAGAVPTRLPADRIRRGRDSRRMREARGPGRARLVQGPSGETWRRWAAGRSRMTSSVTRSHRIFTRRWGEKARSAVGYTSHLLSAKVQFLVEMIVVEVVGPSTTRPRDPDLYNVPLSSFAEDA